MFTKVKNIDTAFQYVRTICLLVVFSCFALCCYVLFKSYQLSAKLEAKIYVLAGDKALEAYASIERTMCRSKPGIISGCFIRISLRLIRTKRR